MANLKKEVAALLSRFDAAQEAFTSNATDLKKLRKQHKKELKAAKKTIASLEEQVADLQKELAKTQGELTLAQAKVTEAPAAATKTSATKRSPGRPKKTAAAKKAAPKAAAAPKATAASEGTPAKASADAPAAPKRRGRPAGTKNKATTAAKKTGTGKPGRPRTKPVVPKSPLEVITGVGPAMARKLEAAGVKTPAGFAKLSNTKMREILDTVGPRYKNASDDKLQAYRDAANTAASK